MEEHLIGANNSRERKLKAFLAKPPRGAALLRMVADVDGAPIRLGEWVIDVVAPSLAGEVLEKLDSHAAECGGVVSVVLSFLSKDGEGLASHVMRRQSSHLTDTEALSQSVMSGDGRGVVSAATAMSIASQRLYMQGMQGLLANYQSVAERDAAAYERLLERCLRAESERDQFREALQQLEACVSQPDASAPQDRVVRILEPLIPVIMQRLLVSSQP